MQEVIEIIKFFTELSRQFKKKKTVRHIQHDVGTTISVEKQNKANTRLHL